MALVAIPSFLHYGPFQTFTAAMNSFTLNDNTGTHYMGFRFRAPKAGTIDRIHHFANNPSANGSGLRARIETDNGSGLPSGTLVAGSSEVILSVTAAGWHRSGAGLGAVVTKGQLLHAVWRAPPSGTAYTGIMNIGCPGEMFPSSDRRTGEVAGSYNNGAQAGTNGFFPWALEYSDGSIPAMQNTWPWGGLGYTGTFNVNSTPDERGVKFQLPFRCRVVGVWTLGSVPAAGNSFSLKLYDAADTILMTGAGGDVPS